MKGLILIILIIILTSGCLTGTKLTYQDTDISSPIRMSAELSDKPMIGRTVFIDFELESDYSDNEMPVEIRLVGPISLTSGTLNDTLEVSDGKAHKSISIRVNEPGYHKITLKSEARSMGYHRFSTIHLEVTENDARIETNPDIRWYE